MDSRKKAEKSFFETMERFRSEYKTSASNAMNKREKSITPKSSEKPPNIAKKRLMGMQRESMIDDNFLPDHCTVHANANTNEQSNFLSPVVLNQNFLSNQHGTSAETSSSTRNYQAQYLAACQRTEQIFEAESTDISTLNEFFYLKSDHLI